MSTTRPREVIENERARRAWHDPATPEHRDMSPRAFEGMAKQILDLARPDGSERVLDVGCGSGHLSAIIRRSVKSLSGIDAVSHRLARAQRALPDASFWCQSFLEPFPGGPYDLIYSFSVLQCCHPRSLQALLDNCVRSLAPGGRIVHGDVLDRAKLRAFYLASPSPRSTMRYLRARLASGPILKDGSYAVDVKAIVRRWNTATLRTEAFAGRDSYRTHVRMTDVQDGER
jgi:SAM-dependent methyltransferase